jgi:hypothetical protein
MGLVWRRGPLRPIAGRELPDFSTVAFILNFWHSHMTVQHTGQLLTCLAWAWSLAWPQPGHFLASAWSLPCLAFYCLFTY